MRATFGETPPHPSVYPPASTKVYYRMQLIMTDGNRLRVAVLLRWLIDTDNKIWCMLSAHRGGHPQQLAITSRPMKHYEFADLRPAVAADAFKEANITLSREIDDLQDLREAMHAVGRISRCHKPSLMLEG